MPDILREIRDNLCDAQFDYDEMVISDTQPVLHIVRGEKRYKLSLEIFDYKPLGLRIGVM